MLRRIRDGVVGLVGHVRNLSNPLYHLRKGLEDLHASREAIRNWHFDDIRDKPEELSQAFRGKLFAVFFLAGPFSMLGMPIGYALQLLLRSPWVGLFGTLAFAQICSTIAYEVIWWGANRRLYHECSHRRSLRFLEALKDVTPVQWKGFKMAATLWLVTIPLNSVIIGILELISHDVAVGVPVPIIVAGTDALLIQTTFIRTMGDIFERHSRWLAGKYGLAPNAETV